MKIKNKIDTIYQIFTENFCVFVCFLTGPVWGSVDINLSIYKHFFKQ